MQPDKPVDRRAFLQQMALVASALATGTFSSQTVAAQISARKPNIVLILADDVGYGDLSCYGATHVHTPHIDFLATTGLRFTNAHCDAATCTPSRYALLTGDYAWRRDGIQVLPGDARSLIQPGQPTIASVLKQAGYATGLAGKWHVGLGEGSIDWNGEIAPGPNEHGFDEAFYFAATADRVPTVYIHDHRVAGLDPKDPIQVSYGKKIGTDPTGKEDPELLKMKLSEGHDGTIVDGISRIGFMTGGNSARWKDEEMASTFTGKAVEFIEAHHAHPFFLYFTPSDIHVPRAPGPEFAGKDACGVRCDVISQLDWSVGRIVDTLKRLHLDQDTLVIFTSDNGPVVNDGYNDGSDRALGEHKPAGPFRGGKYTILEGGTRIPFIASWPRQIAPHKISTALISQLDLLRSLAALTHASVPPNAAGDSEDILQALLGRSKVGRATLIEEATCLAIVEGNWKLIDRTQRPGVHPAPAPAVPRADFSPDPQEKYPVANFELYDLATDPHESKNLADQHPEMVALLRAELAAIRAR